jgi:hypothetical protein
MQQMIVDAVEGAGNTENRVGYNRRAGLSPGSAITGLVILGNLDACGCHHHTIAQIFPIGSLDAGACETLRIDLQAASGDDEASAFRCHAS